jgi:hypothetical protein
MKKYYNRKMEKENHRTFGDEAEDLDFIFST